MSLGTILLAILIIMLCGGFVNFGNLGTGYGFGYAGGAAADPDHRGSRAVAAGRAVTEPVLRTKPRLDAAIAAAEAATTDLPAIVTGLEVLEMGEAKWKALLKAGDWAAVYNRDASVNMSHPDVKRAMAEFDKAAAHV